MKLVWPFLDPSESVKRSGWPLGESSGLFGPKRLQRDVAAEGIPIWSIILSDGPTDLMAFILENTRLTNPVHISKRRSRDPNTCLILNEVIHIDITSNSQKLSIIGPSNHHRTTLMNFCCHVTLELTETRWQTHWPKNLFFVCCLWFVGLQNVWTN